MTTFLAAVEQVQRDLAARLGSEASYLSADQRREEAGVVDPCVGRFVEGEMDPDERLTVARGGSVGPLGAPPSLAAKLGDRLDGAARETVDGARFAVSKALAAGYLSIVETEERAGIAFHPERSTEDLWEFWMTECRVMLEDTGVPKSFAKAVRGMGGDLLIADLKKLKLARFLGGSKVNQLGLLYAQAGAHLRMGQTENTPTDLFDERVRLRRNQPERPWRLEE